MRLVYAAEAVTDLIRLRECIAEHDLQAAARVAVQLLSRLRRLVEFPDIGRLVTDESEAGALRDLVAGRYVARYSVHPSALVVLRVWHELEDRES